MGPGTRQRAPDGQVQEARLPVGVLPAASRAAGGVRAEKLAQLDRLAEVDAYGP